MCSVIMLCWSIFYFLLIVFMQWKTNCHLCLFKSISMKFLWKTITTMFVYVYRSPCIQLPKFITLLFEEFIWSICWISTDNLMFRQVMVCQSCSFIWLPCACFKIVFVYILVLYPLRKVCICNEELHSLSF